MKKYTVIAMIGVVVMTYIRINLQVENTFLFNLYMICFVVVSNWVSYIIEYWINNSNKNKTIKNYEMKIIKIKRRFNNEKNN